MATRYYSNTAPPTTLTAGINAITTTITIASAAGLPPFQPFTMALDPNTPTMELVEVTAAAGTTLTVTRAIDGTSASTHGAGAVAMHVSSARDFAEANAHINASTNVHGLTGGASVVGTTTVQTLTNKTISGPIISDGTITNSAITTNQLITGSGGAALTASGGTSPLVVTSNPAGGPNILEVVDESGNDAIIVQDNGFLDITRGAHIEGGDNIGSTAVIIKQGTFASTGVLSIRNNSDVEMLGVYTDQILANVPLRPATETASGAGVFAVAAGWTLVSAIAYKAAGVTTLNVTVQRSGANIVATAAGDIVDSLLGTISATWRPNAGFTASDFALAPQNSIGNGGANMAVNTGNVTLRSWSSGGTISTTNNVNFTATYVV